MKVTLANTNQCLRKMFDARFSLGLTMVYNTLTRILKIFWINVDDSAGHLWCCYMCGGDRTSNHCKFLSVKWLKASSASHPETLEETGGKGWSRWGSRQIGLAKVQELDKLCPYKNLDTNVYNSFINNHQRQEPIKMSFNWINLELQLYSGTFQR